MQLQQLINLLLLLALGKYVAHFYLSWLEIAGILLFTVFIEHLFLYFKHKKLYFISFSSLTTATGVILMMVATDYYIYLFVIILGLLQKHFLHYRGQHFFNPSNFALILALLLFYQESHIVLGQLGSDYKLMILVGILAVSILYRAKRWIIPVVFILAYVGLQKVFIVSSDPVMIIDDVYLRFYSLSFIVFILFMLTDPRTTPNKSIHQVLFSVVVAVVAVLLDYYQGFRVQHLFMALFLVTPLSVAVLNFTHFQDRKRFFFVIASILILSFSAILYIEVQAPYYFEMDR